MLFRGGLVVQDSEAGSVSDVLLAYERLTDPPRPPDHYRTALNERTDPETAALKFFDRTAPQTRAFTRRNRRG